MKLIRKTKLETVDLELRTFLMYTYLETMFTFEAIGLGNEFFFYEWLKEYAFIFTKFILSENKNEMLEKEVFIKIFCSIYCISNTTENIFYFL